jgi:FKBP-type peptidyl-prolyl cis-trans isomerase FkpA
MINKLLSILLVLSALTLSCKKETRNLKEIQDAEILSYLRSNNLNNFIKDTSGFYYNILQQGKGKILQDSDLIFYFQNIKTQSGVELVNHNKYNYNTNYLGYLSYGPIGFYKSVLAVVNKGGKIRSIIPSYMAYGKDGNGGLVKGNELIDATFEVINAKNVIAAEDTIITRYKKTLNIDFTRDASGVYYNIITPGDGASVSLTSTISASYVGKFFDGVQFDASAAGAPIVTGFGRVIKGWQVLTKIKKGGKMRLLIPSHRAYGTGGFNTIPANTPLDFEIELVDVK